MKLNSRSGLIWGLLPIFLVLFVQSTGLLFATDSVFVTTSVMGVMGAIPGVVVLRKILKEPLLRDITPRLLGMAVVVALANTEIFLVTASAQRIGLGAEATIFTFGAIALNFRYLWRWRVAAIVGVLAANVTAGISSGGGFMSLAVGLGLALLAAAMNNRYLAAVYGENKLGERQFIRMMALGLILTMVFSGAIGVVGHFAFGVGALPDTSGFIKMTLMGVAVFGLPPIVYTLTASRIPQELAGFVFLLPTITSALAAAIFASLGWVSETQMPSLLTVAGVVFLFGVILRVSWAGVGVNEKSMEIEEEPENDRR